MKITHIFWSLLIVFGAMISLWLLSHKNGSPGTGINVYAFILLLLAISTAAGALVTLLIALKTFHPRNHFGVTFLFVINAFWGLLLTFEICTGDIQYSLVLATSLAGLNLLWAMLLLILTTRKRMGNAEHSVT